jgi:hypothetical protein
MKRDLPYGYQIERVRAYRSRSTTPSWATSEKRIRRSMTAGLERKIKIAVAYWVDHRTAKDIAHEFCMTPGAVEAFIRRLRKD